MKPHFKIFGSVLFFAAVQFAAGQGTVIVQHTGYNDPTSEGFGAGFTPGNGVIVGPVTNDMGMDAWSITESSVATSYYDFNILSVAGLDWELTGTLRIVTPDTPSGAFSLSIGTGAENFTLYFGSQANDDPTFIVQGSSLSPTLVLNGAGSSYNTYQLLYDAPSDTASLWVNGVEQLGDIYGRAYGTPSAVSSLSWGIGTQSSSLGEANWNLVSLEVVPEPSSAALVLLGSGVLVCLRRKHRC